MAEQKKNKLFWLHIILGIVVILVAALLFPLWKYVEWAPWKNWGTIVVNLILAVFLSYYIFGFIVKRFGKAHHKTVNFLTVVEFILLMLIDIYLIVGQWVPGINILKINNACAVTGFALYIRGVIEIIRAYYYRQNVLPSEQNKEKYPLWWLFIAILFVSLGMYLFICPIFTDEAIVWIFDIFLLLCGLYLFFYGIFTKPKKEKKQ